MNKLVKYGIGIAIIGVLGVGFYQKVFIPKHTFKIVTPTKKDMVIKVDGVGNVGSENSYKVSAIYGGKVTNFSIQLGDFVKKGDIIALIDSVDLKDKIDEVKANIKVIKANIESTKIDKESAYKDYLYQEDVLKKNKKLYQKRAISELEYKKYLTNRDIAKLKVDSLSKKIESLKNQLPQLQASLKGLEERLKRYTIISPIDGYVVKKYITNYDTVGNNQPLIEIVNPKDVWIDTFIDTRISGDVVIGDKSMIKLRSGLKTRGYVYKLNPVNNAVTNEREIFIRFKKVPIPFYINEQAIVTIKIKSLNGVYTIPAKAISFNNKKQGVWVLKGDKAHFIPVKVIAHNDKAVAIDKKDIKVIIPNPKKKTLSEGMKIYHD